MQFLPLVEATREERGRKVKEMDFFFGPGSQAQIEAARARVEQQEYEAFRERKERMRRERERRKATTAAIPAIEPAAYARLTKTKLEKLKDRLRRHDELNAALRVEADKRAAEARKVL
jgi:hypothetical protein